MKKRCLSAMLAMLVICITMAVFIPVHGNAAESEFKPILPVDVDKVRVIGLDYYNGGASHNGIDFTSASANYNYQNIYAVADGVVFSARSQCTHNDNTNSEHECPDTWGNYICIKHTVNGTTYFSLYAHLKYNSFKVNVGDAVSAGQMIAQMASTGGSTGHHLHLQIWQGSWDVRSYQPLQAKAFDYYQNNPETIDNLVFLSGLATNSTRYGSWIKENCVIESGNYVYHYGHTISFHNTPAGTTTTKSVEDGKPLGTLPIPEVSGMYFDGWYTKAFGQGIKVTSSTVLGEDTNLYAHYTYNGIQMNFNANGGSLPGTVASATADGVNLPRYENTLRIYNKAGATVDTNIHGNEVVVAYNGKVVETRPYGTETQLIVPEGGFVLSGHGTNHDFVGDIIDMETAFVSVNWETGAVKVFDSYSSYLTEHKRLSEGDTYGDLPVPTRPGYAFAGWSVSGGRLVNYYSTYSEPDLWAVWEKADSMKPAATVVYNGHLYELYDHNMTWKEAKALCEEKGGYLVAITSADEQSALQSLVVKGTRGYYYIGATDEAKEGTWKWVNGETFAYSNWDQTLPEPSNGSEEHFASIIAKDYGYNKQSGEWVDNPNEPVYGFYDMSNGGFVCEYDSESAGEPCNYVGVYTPATCVKLGYTTYTCSVHGESYVVKDEAGWSEWSETYPTGVDKNRIESRTEYRYADFSRFESTQPNLSGFTLVSSSWRETGTKTVQFVESWPSGFYKSNALYTTYNKTPFTATTGELEKVTTETDTCGYIYYHWCRNSYADGPINRSTNQTQTSTYATFHAFFSTEAAPQYDPSGNNGQASRYFPNASCCKDSYWYYPVEVKQQTATTYEKVFTYEGWSDWSAWGTTAYQTSSTRKVETRTVYRYSSALADHKMGNWYSVSKPNGTNPGEDRRDCANCDHYETRAVSLSSITVTTKPSKLTYLEGETFNAAGMVVTAYYNNGTNAPVTGYTISGYSATPGTKMITVSYGGKSATFTVTVAAKSLQSIAVTTKPNKLTYLEGESFNAAGMVVTAYYNNGTSEIVTDYTVSGYDSTPGTKTITVSYGGKSATLTVTVTAKSLQSIAVTTKPNKLTYLEGESFNAAGMVVTVYYNNGTSETVTDYTVSGYDSTPGTKIITVSYGGKSGTFTVTVTAKSLQSIAVTTKPNKLTYLEGESFNAAGMVVTAYYNNGTNAPVTGYTVSGYSSTPGTKTITVSYGGKSATFTVTVNAKPVGSHDVYRIYGSNRFDTAFGAANMLKETLSVEKFENIIVACGTNFADALAGSYLGKVKNAPILLVQPNMVSAVREYIEANLQPGGTVYLLGGETIVPGGVSEGLNQFVTKRLWGANRYETNLAILREAGVTGGEILVCTGYGFADSLSASAVGKPILLVDKKLTAGQEAYLAGLTNDSYVIVGGVGAVNEVVEESLRGYGAIERLAGANRFTTSVMVAERFFDSPTTAVVAYAANFPDGLCGGPLAAAMGGPLLLTANNDAHITAAYTEANSIRDGVVLGGPGLISDAAVRKVFAMRDSDNITVK